MYFYYGLAALNYFLFPFSQGVGISGFSAVADQLRLAALQEKREREKKNFSDRFQRTVLNVLFVFVRRFY